MAACKLYFDPGGVCAGWALFLGRKLIACGLSRTKLKQPFLRAQAHRAALQAVWDAKFEWGEVPYTCKSEAMWYRPVTYIDKRTGKKKKRNVPPQDIIDVNLIAGHAGTEWIYPHEWKGMTPKENHQPLILACLDAEERKLVDAVMPKGLRHNCIDAVGIGLHDVGRLSERELSECEQQVKSRIELTVKQPKKGGTQRGSRTSQSKSKTRGKQRRTPPAFITLPKGALLGPMARANLSRGAPP